MERLLMRMKGKRPTILGIEFGEKVVHKLKYGQNLQKINFRWELGIFVGVRKRSNDLAIAAEDGIHFVRSVKRIPFERRWGGLCWLGDMGPMESLQRCSGCRQRHS